MLSLGACTLSTRPGTTELLTLGGTGNGWFAGLRDGGWAITAIARSPLSVKEPDGTV